MRFGLRLVLFHSLIVISFLLAAPPSSGQDTTPPAPPFGLTADQPPPGGDNTQLAQLAASLQAGQWAELPTLGLAGGAFLETQVPASSILQWAERAVWDPNSRRLFYHGAPHGHPEKFIIYNDSNNTWTSGPVAPPCSTSCVHGYEHNAINPATGEVYYRPYNIKQVYKYAPGSNSWSELPEIPMPFVQCCGALEWFPERNELLFFDGDWGIWAYTPANNQWRQVAQTNANAGVSGLPQFPMAPYNNIAHYSPQHKLILFGGTSGGTNYLYKYSNSGAITRLANAPISILIASSLIALDPVSGHFVVLGDGKTFYDYDVATDTWTAKNAATAPPIWGIMSDPNDVFDTIAAPISNYGVVMYLRYYPGATKVYIYKHKVN